jgi:phosphoglycerate dehydrogenase-like enzyme
MKVLVADANIAPHRERFEAALPSGVDVAWCARRDPQTLGDELGDVDVYVGGRFTARMAEAAEKLRLIHVAGAGTDRIDFAALPDGVLVANTFHHERSIAEYVLSAAIMLRRDFIATPAWGSSGSATSANARGNCCAPSDPRVPR